MPHVDSPLRTYRTAKKLSLDQLGQMFGVHKTTAMRWEAKGIPPERVLEIEAKLRIPRQKLRPDLYLSRPLGPS